MMPTTRTITGHRSIPAQPPFARRRTTALAVASAAAFVVACWPAAPVQVRLVDPGATELEPVEHAVAVLHPVGGSDVHGVVGFEALAEPPAPEQGLRVRARVAGLPGTRHAFHVHLLGDCSGESGKRAGTHFNFQGPSRDPAPDIDRITGDLGDLEADPNGVASHDGEVADARLYGPFSILGRAVIVHASPNDPDEPPIGAAGPRLACGVIGIAAGPVELAARTP